jgi:DNA mismatch repair protein MutL
MNRIRLLPEHVANQIAAGEVVERPASVVKELVENALDAHATRVGLEIQGGGRSLVRVTDDGVGMSRDDALLCLERHATSKIQRAEDLAAVSTLGFRGEALPSIASVSRFTLTTRERGAKSPEGTRIVVSGGKMMEVKAAGAPEGTMVEVRQLFFNLPARRKFLRSEETESAHIQHYLTLAALSFPEVAFTFQKDGRTVWQLPSIHTGNDVRSRMAALRERLRGLYSGDQELVPVDFSEELASGSQPEEDDAGGFDAALAPGESAGETSNPFRLWGWIGAPGVSRATRDEQHLFVNRRPVENRGLNYALLEGYHTALMKGRYPVCCLFLELSPAAVDVNIHPAKKEVKFHRESEIRRLVSAAVRQALLDYHRRKPATETKADQAPPAQSTPGIAPAPAARQESRGTVPAALPSFPVARQPPGESGKPAPSQPTLHLDLGGGGSAALATVPAGKVGPGDSLGPAVATQIGGESPTTTRQPEPAGPPMRGPVPLLDVPLRMIGVVGRLYVVFESDRGLVLLDQHAAHERILFEQMLERLERKDLVPAQKLLLPETVELSARDAAFLREQIPVLTRLGVGLSEFGERTFLLDALPPFVRAQEPRRFVIELVDQLKAAGREINSARLGEQVVAKTVCRHAVKAHDSLSKTELENLVRDLRHCAMPYTCPHGRPTLIEMSFRELEKKFGRVQ